MTKGERGTRELFGIFRVLRLKMRKSSRPILLFFDSRYFCQIFFRFSKQQKSSTELFGKSPNYSVPYRIIRYPTELFGTLPNYSVPYRIIRSTELFSPPPL
jgi:hypothetical protein